MVFRGYCIFQSTSEAFEVGRILGSPSFREFGLVFEYCPAPREYSTDCTLALYFESIDESYMHEEIESLSTRLDSGLRAKGCVCKVVCLSEK
ncbi:putative Se/S carrier-like protein [uncultured Helicobacter sp.]|uniref:putative Se/S carrier-like protein n=1 Tax=uncultured Helicobacter sp. TaxID=175537 RepID=UPI00374F79C9